MDSLFRTSFVPPTLIWGTRVLRRFLEDQLDAFYNPLQISDRRLALCRYAAAAWFDERRSQRQVTLTSTCRTLLSMGPQRIPR